MDAQCGLFRAVKSGDCTAAGRYLDEGADTNMPTPEGETPLLLAVERGNIILLLLLGSTCGGRKGSLASSRTFPRVAVVTPLDNVPGTKNLPVT